MTAAKDPIGDLIEMMCGGALDHEGLDAMRMAFVEAVRAAARHRHLRGRDVTLDHLTGEARWKDQQPDRHLCLCSHGKEGVDSR